MAVISGTRGVDREGEDRRGSSAQRRHGKPVGAGERYYCKWNRSTISVNPRCGWIRCAERSSCHGPTYGTGGDQGTSGDGKARGDGCGADCKFGKSAGRTGATETVAE